MVALSIGFKHNNGKVLKTQDFPKLAQKAPIVQLCA
jgi:hypothetical protein